MKTPAAAHVVHGSFSIERSYRASPARVFAAWADVETKARWFCGPPDAWTPMERSLDVRVGGTELLRGELASGVVSTFTARYHAIVPDRRLVFAYDMHHGDRHLSTSLATVELELEPGGGTRMTFTEQAAFLDGEDGTRSREHGTSAHFERLANVLDDPRDIVSSRVFDAPRERVFAAFTDAKTLASWWGPSGFTNEFRVFEPRTGGAWRFSMRGPDGAHYEMIKDFTDVAVPARIVLENRSPTHAFTMTMTFTDLGPRTHLAWRLRFESTEEAARVREAIAVANEQNFDRLAAALADRGP